MELPKERLGRLKDACTHQCKNCDLYKTRKNLVFGDGSPNAKIMFVGEAPGAEEDQQGLPFVGRSGKLLRKLIAAINLPPEHYYIANILKDRPPNNRPPTPMEIKGCLPILEKQIEIISPKILVLLGKTAVTGIIPEQAEVPMGMLRKESMNGSMSFKGIPVFITYHPSAILRQPSLKSPYVEDFNYIKGIVKTLISC
jgi:DNA polymerase